MDVRDRLEFTLLLSIKKIHYFTPDLRLVQNEVVFNVPRMNNREIALKHSQERVLEGSKSFMTYSNVLWILVAIVISKPFLAFGALDHRKQTPPPSLMENSRPLIEKDLKADYGVKRRIDRPRVKSNEPAAPNVDAELEKELDIQSQSGSLSRDSKQDYESEILE